MNQSVPQNSRGNGGSGPNGGSPHPQNGQNRRGASLPQSKAFSPPPQSQRTVQQPHPGGGNRSVAMQPHTGGGNQSGAAQRQGGGAQNAANQNSMRKAQAENRRKTLAPPGRQYMPKPPPKAPQRPMPPPETPPLPKKPPKAERAKEGGKGLQGLLERFLPSGIYNPETKKLFGILSAEDLLLVALIFLISDSEDEESKILILALLYLLISDRIDLSDIF